MVCFPLSFPGHTLSVSCLHPYGPAQLCRWMDKPFWGASQVRSPAPRVTGVSLEVSDPWKFRGHGLKLALGQVSQQPSSALQFWVVATSITKKNLLETRETNPDNKGPRGLPSH